LSGAAAATGSRAPAASGARAGDSNAALMEAVQIEFQTTPFRAERFAELYGPAVPRVLAYGAKGYLFYRSVEDPQHFVHLSLWEDRAAFDRWWFSREMQEVRESIAGIHEQPVLPHGSLVLQYR
jgi:quinol monooxygenase YgiN